jgi:AI-2 transport protein TqsA
MMDKTKTTNILLLILVVPVVFYVLKLLSFIFIPLVLSMFIALLFLPLMRWFRKSGMPKTISILFIVLIIFGILILGSEIIQLASKEFISADPELFSNIEQKLVNLVVKIENFFGIYRIEGDNIIVHYAQKYNLNSDIGNTINLITDTLSMTLMTVFFSILWLSESINFQKLLNSTIFKQKHTSIKVFIRIEKELIKFIIVKVIISLITGLGFFFACLLFDVSFPVFWGLFAFAINFLQMIGSFISVAVLSLFAMVELNVSGNLLVFMLVISGIQAIMGGVVEPVFMGKSFSINVITILVMLMFWGFLWGVPGLILSIPITVFIKIILEQYQSTKIIADIMAGNRGSLLPGNRIL